MEEAEELVGALQHGVLQREDATAVKGHQGRETVVGGHDRCARKRLEEEGGGAKSSIVTNPR